MSFNLPFSILSRFWALATVTYRLAADTVSGDSSYIVETHLDVIYSMSDEKQQTGPLGTLV